MGLFDLFASKEERAQGALQKLRQKLLQKFGPPENRAKAIDQLLDLGTPEALQLLCMRFTISADPTITDAEEKERVLQLLVDEGEAAVEPIQRFVHQQEQGVGWALRALSRILSAERLGAVVLGELAHLGQVYSRDPEKKLTLLTWLREHPAGVGGEAVEAAVLPLLEDFSDDVRIAATRALAALAGGERTRAALIDLLLRDKENLRVRGEVFEALAEPRRRREGAPPQRRGAHRRAVLPGPRRASEEAGPVSDPARDRSPPHAGPARGARSFLDRWFEPVRVAREAPATLSALARCGTVVLVMRSPGLLELLFARWIAPRLGLAPLRAAAGYRGFVAKLLGIRRSRPGFAATVAEGGTTVVFLGRERSLAPFVQLLALRAARERPVFLVPALLTWSRRVPRLEGSFWDLLYGAPDAPTPFANLVGFLRNHERATFDVGEAVEVGQFAAAHAGDLGAGAGRPAASPPPPPPLPRVPRCGRPAAQGAVAGAEQGAPRPLPPGDRGPGRDRDGHAPLEGPRARPSTTSRSWPAASARASSRSRARS